mmetsp:Transcript_41944/g.110711  ORF Transcript_41944/g.110711 Transcript_41944/m.110711 type:complete len:216 (+) Transcript_41944:227-874(+)
MWEERASSRPSSEVRRPKTSSSVSLCTASSADMPLELSLSEESPPLAAPCSCGHATDRSTASPPPPSQPSLSYLSPPPPKPEPSPILSSESMAASVAERRAAERRCGSAPSRRSSSSCVQTLGGLGAIDSASLCDASATGVAVASASGSASASASEGMLHSAFRQPSSNTAGPAPRSKLPRPTELPTPPPVPAVAVPLLLGLPWPPWSPWRPSPL